MRLLITVSYRLMTNHLFRKSFLKVNKLEKIERIIQKKINEVQCINTLAKVTFYKVQNLLIKTQII